MSEKQAVLPQVCITLDEHFKAFSESPCTDDPALLRKYEVMHENILCRERQLLTLLQSLADAGIEVVDGKVVSDWIKVEDGLPKAGQDILFEVPSCYGVEKGKFHPDLSEPWMSDRTSPYNEKIHWHPHMVTRWMLLPAPPTDSTKEVA